MKELTQNELQNVIGGYADAMQDFLAQQQRESQERFWAFIERNS